MTHCLKRIKAAGKLRIGIAGDIPGISYFNPQNHQAEGFEPDFGRWIAKELFGDEKHVEFIKVQGGNSRVESLKENRVDLIISVFTITDERLEEIAFSKPYYLDKDAVLILKHGEIKHFNDLRGKKVAVIANSATLDNFKRYFPEAHLVVFKFKPDAIQELKKHSVAALASDYTILTLMNFSPYGGKELFSVLETTDEFPAKKFGIGIQKGCDDLLQFVNLCVDKFEADGFLKKSLKKHGWKI